jgi:hypothetical protein
MPLRSTTSQQRQQNQNSSREAVRSLSPQLNVQV